MIKLRVETSELESHFKTVEHDTFQKALTEHWKVIGDNVKAQSVCWLFCWAKTGMNSQNAMQQSRQVFDKIFQTITFSDFDKKVSHGWAREARYRTENIEEELNDLLSGKHVINKKTYSRKTKYKNDDFENKKEFEKYRINKKNLKGFEAAERFLLRLESMDEGFYVSPRTNLHCYYKDRYLFYLHDFSQFSIKLRQQYNNIINKGTYDYSAHFFEQLKSKINSTKGISITESGICTFEIGNSDKADNLFDFIYNEMQIVAREIDNDSKEEQDENFEEKIEEARKLTKEERLSRLKNYPEYPTSSEKKTISYNRNQYVVAEVLERANGKCEFCMQDAPFGRTTDGTPFLEVHHIEHLSDGGKDTIDNAIALCPNCHRGAHYGGFKIKNNNR
mgnify:CR=1 FL=1